jgi:hypothetical protein
MAVQAFSANIVKNNMKNFLLLSLCLFAISCSLKHQIKSEVKKAESIQIKPSQEFVQGSEDIPLIDGMEKVFDESLGFDSSSGSIMSSTYETKNNLEEVKKFYLETLPQMGWKSSKKKNAKVFFKRENEELEIETIKEGEKNLVKFFISSAL